MHWLARARARRDPSRSEGRQRHRLERAAGSRSWTSAWRAGSIRRWRTRRPWGRSRVRAVTIGTPYAMAPEQVRAGTLDHRTDIWALGVLLYEMVSGRQPFTGATLAELMASILRDPPAPLRLSPAAEPIRTMIETCLAKDPNQRYQHAEDVKLALQEIGRVARRRQPSRGAMLAQACRSSDRRSWNGRRARAPLSAASANMAGWQRPGRAPKRAAGNCAWWPASPESARRDCRSSSRASALTSTPSSSSAAATKRRWCRISRSSRRLVGTREPLPSGAASGDTREQRRRSRRIRARVPRPSAELARTDADERGGSALPVVRDRQRTAVSDVSRSAGPPLPRRSPLGRQADAVAVAPRRSRIGAGRAPVDRHLSRERGRRPVIRSASCSQTCGANRR